MPPSTLALCLLLALLKPSLLSGQPPTGAVAGFVRNELTGEPVRRATVTLRTLSLPKDAPPEGRSTTLASGADGAFRFDNVSPGEYQVSAGRAGFLGAGQPRMGRTPYSARIRVQPGETTGPVELKLQPAAVLTGLVLDEEGEPVPAAHVTLLRRQFVDGAWRWQGQSSDRTRDTGDYRIASVPPGRYWVAARSPRAPVPQTSGAQPEAYANTLYPSAADFASATYITLTPGMVTEGIDIRLRKTTIVRVSGQIEGPPHDQLEVRLSPRDPLAASYVSGVGVRVDSSGRFSFPHVEPGTYWLELRDIRGAPWNLSWLSLDVGNQDIGDVVLRPSGFGSLTGRARVEGPPTTTASTPGPPAHGWFITLTALYGPRWHSPQIRFAGDGTFHAPELPPGRYQVTAHDGSPDAYLKAVSAGGVESADHSLTLAEGGETHAELVFARDVARATGIVTAADGAPIGGAIVTFVPTRWLGSVLETIGQATVPTNDDGRFGPHPLAPGEYLVQAWEALDYGAHFDPELRDRAQRWTRRITLPPGGETEIELTAIPASAITGP
jgi:hypothetical protein